MKKLKPDFTKTFLISSFPDLFNQFCRINKNVLFSVIILLLIFPLILSAQLNWTPYHQHIDVKEYQGKKFVFTAAVRTEIEDSEAAARLWVRVDKEKGMGFFENMDKSPVRTTSWETYSIEGTIDSGAVSLYFGLICVYNGHFFFDNFELKVEDKSGRWKMLFSSDFEEEAKEPETALDDWTTHPNEFYQATIIKDDTNEENHCLRVTGKGVPIFGVNDKEGKYAAVNGIKLYYEVYGEGHPLIVLHGNGGSISSSTLLYPEWIKKYKVIAVDSRAQGKSTDTDEEITYELMASDINELMNQLDIDSAYLWGHSDGAIIGLVMAMNYPDRFSKILAFAPNIVADTTGIEAPIYRWIEETAQNTEDSTERKLTYMMWKHPNISFTELEKIDAAVLLMSGDRDFVPLAHTLEIFKHIPNSQLCIIPGSTHVAYMFKKDLVMDIVIEFFDKPFKMPDTRDWF